MAKLFKGLGGANLAPISHVRDNKTRWIPTGFYEFLGPEFKQNLFYFIKSYTLMCIFHCNIIADYRRRR